MSEPEGREKIRTNLLDLLPVEAEAELKAFSKANGQPDYRANQIMQHLWSLPRESFDFVLSFKSSRGKKYCR